MSEIQFQKTFYGIAASLVEGDKVTSGIGRTYSEAEEALREKLSNRSEPSPEPGAAPASEAQAPAVPGEPIDHRRNCPAWTNAEGYEVNGEDCTCGKRWRIDIQTLHELRAAWEKRAYESEAELASLREKLARAEARVEILDAQEVELPDWEPNKDAADEWWERIKDHEGGSVGAKAWYQCALSRERQLLDALRALQACRGVAQQQNEALKFLAQEADGEISPATFEFANSVAAAYDALAGKDGE